MKKKNLAVKTQQHKSVKIRDLYNKMTNGIPLNVPVRQMFDSGEPNKESDVDDDFYDENADPLEVLQFKRDKAESVYYENKKKQDDLLKQFSEEAKKAAAAAAELEKIKKEKGGIKDETSKDETSQS